MKNNTKIRLHLSKQLFETLTKQVLAEAKANDGYSVAVKQPKQAGETKAQKAAPEVKSTDKMKKMEEKMSSKEKMAKGLYKETEKMGEMETNVAEGSLNEGGAVDALITAVGVLGAGGISYAIMKLQDLFQRKFPKEYEKAQQARSTMSKGNPGLGV